MHIRVQSCPHMHAGTSSALRSPTARRRGSESPHSPGVCLSGQCALRPGPEGGWPPSALTHTQTHTHTHTHTHTYTRARSEPCRDMAFVLDVVQQICMYNVMPSYAPMHVGCRPVLCLFVCMFVCLFVRLFVCVCAFVCVCVCLCASSRERLCIFSPASQQPERVRHDRWAGLWTHTHTHIHTQKHTHSAHATLRHLQRNYPP